MFLKLAEMGGKIVKKKPPPPRGTTQIVLHVKANLLRKRQLPYLHTGAKTVIHLKPFW